MKVITSHVAVKARITTVFFFTIAISSGIAAYVLWFQRYRSASGIWDFQTTATVATVIPSFAGVLLAAWAVYFQIKTNAPSYRAAEKSWLDIHELQQRVLRIGALLTTIPTEESNDLQAADVDVSDELERADPPDWRYGANRKAQGLGELRCAKEFLVENDFNDGDSRTLGRLALSAFPLLDSLQHISGFPQAQRLDLIGLESAIDSVAATHEPNADYSDRAAWISKAIDVLKSINGLIEALATHRLLTVEKIEEALLSPRQSEVIRKWVEETDVAAAYRREQRKSYPNLLRKR